VAGDLCTEKPGLTGDTSHLFNTEQRPLVGVEQGAKSDELPLQQSDGGKGKPAISAYADG